MDDNGYRNRGYDGSGNNLPMNDPYFGQYYPPQEPMYGGGINYNQTSYGFRENTAGGYEQMNTEYPFDMNTSFPYNHMVHPYQDYSGYEEMPPQHPQGYEYNPGMDGRQYMNYPPPPPHGYRMEMPNQNYYGEYVYQPGYGQCIPQHQPPFNMGNQMQPTETRSSPKYKVYNPGNHQSHSSPIRPPLQPGGSQPRPIFRNDKSQLDIPKPHKKKFRFPTPSHGNPPWAQGQPSIVLPDDISRLEQSFPETVNTSQHSPYSFHNQIHSPGRNFSHQQVAMTSLEFPDLAESISSTPVPKPRIPHYKQKLSAQDTFNYTPIVSQVLPPPPQPSTPPTHLSSSLYDTNPINYEQFFAEDIYLSSKFPNLKFLLPDLPRVTNSKFNHNILEEENDLAFVEKSNPIEYLNYMMEDSLCISNKLPKTDTKISETDWPVPADYLIYPHIKDKVCVPFI